MDVQEIKEKVFNRQKVEKNPVDVPGNDGNKEASDGVQDVVIGRRDDGGENEERVAHAHDNEHGPTELVCVEGAAVRHGRDSETDNERVAEVKGGHGS